MKISDNDVGHIVLVPETVAEAGMIFCIAKRFNDRMIKIEFNTKDVYDEKTDAYCTYPALWIHDCGRNGELWDHAKAPNNLEEKNECK